MSIGSLRVLAVIPARGGSKGIPGKNLRTAGDRSLLAHAIRLAQACDEIDEILVSTDSEDIAEEAARHGLPVPFLRPDELASDEAGALGMWQHAWKSMEASTSSRFDLSVLLQPTSPFRTVEDIQRVLRELAHNGHESAATVGISSAHHSPEKLLVRNTDDRIEGYLQKSQQRSNRQDIQTYYHRDGICYGTTREALLERDTIIGEDCASVVIERTLVNIDTPDELALADWILSRQPEDFHLSGLTDFPDLIARELKQKA